MLERNEGTYRSPKLQNLDTREIHQATKPCDTSYSRLGTELLRTSHDIARLQQHRARLFSMPRQKKIKKLCT